jgi:hypothetical protein
MYNIDMEKTKVFMEKLDTALDCYKAELRLVKTTNERLEFIAKLTNSIRLITYRMEHKRLTTARDKIHMEYEKNGMFRTRRTTNK